MAGGDRLPGWAYFWKNAGLFRNQFRSHFFDSSFPTDQSVFPNIILIKGRAGTGVVAVEDNCDNSFFLVVSDKAISK